MQEIFTSDWYVILIASFLLGVFHIYLNKGSFNIKFPKNSILLMLLTSFFLWISISLFNKEVEWFYLVIPIIAALLISSLIQSFNTKFPFLSSLISFTAFFMLTKVNLPPDNLFLGVFCTTLIATQVLTLLKTQEFNNNIFSSLTATLPIYLAMIWNNSLGLTEPNLTTRNITILSVIIIALAYSFAINNLKLEYKWSRVFSLLIAFLLTYLLMNNFLLIPLNYTLLIISGLIIAQVLEIISLKTSSNPKSFTLSTILALGIILSVGFIITRLFGVWGLIITAGCLLATSSSNSYSKENVNWPAIAALFFVLKAVVNYIIMTTTLNITGLNLNHPYVYVGLVLGITLPFAILALLITYGKTFKGTNILTILIAGIILPLLTLYLIHCEAIGAMILALSISSIFSSLIALILGILLNNNISKIVSNAILPLSTLMGFVVLINTNLIEIGEMATKQERFEVFAGFVLISMLILIVFRSNKTKELQESN